MSREFGDYGGGYFHDKIRLAAEDASSGEYEITRLWGKLLTDFYEVAYAIASAEARDASEGDAILESMEMLPQISRDLTAIDSYQKPFRDIARRAVQRYLRDNRPKEGGEKA